MNKKQRMILSLLIPAFLASCSTEEPVNGGGSDGKDFGYIAVNIVQPKSTATRAVDFENGTEEENTASKALFFIFDKDGKALYGDPQRVDIEKPNDNNAYNIYNAVLIINGETAGPISNANQIICVLNAPEGLENGIKTLDNLTKKIDDYGKHSSGTFIMSNSVYMDGSNKCIGAVVEKDDIKETEADAKSNPVDIYVERVVAKVRAKSADNFDNTEGANPYVDGEKKKLTIVPTGIEIANIAKTSYLLKNLDTNSTSWPAKLKDNNFWNDNVNFRSYWEITPSDLEYYNRSYKDIYINSNIAQDGTENKFDITKVDLTEYIQPNTNNDNKKTAILVTAQLMDGDSPADLAYIHDGYTTTEGAMNVVAKFLYDNGYRKMTTEGGNTKYTELAAADLEWKNNNDGLNIEGLKSYEVIAQVKVGTENIYKRTDKNGQEEYIDSNADEVNTFLKSEDGLRYRARVFTDGKCYYYVNIDQSTVVRLKSGDLEGVVRNHIYDLTLKSIKGIGVPVFDPEDVIIPETPDDDRFYLSARINVLCWRIVTQHVNFGKQE